MPVTNAASGIKAGTVAHFAASTAPTGWLKANGAAVSRTAYEALFQAIGTTYGAGDGSTTFALPDLRGEFLRSLDDGRGVDSGRAIGSTQSDMFKTHDHGLKANMVSGIAGGPNANMTVGGGSRNYYNTDAYVGNTETRPRNVALLACIKF